MKRAILSTFLAILFLAAIPLPSRAEDDRLEKLSPEHRKWLVEEVVYIILDRERDVFLTLETVDDRDRFIEAFWRKRDPNRATPENEFKEEHYRRVEYANKFLGRETFRKGWQTDRGEMYIILGKPLEVQRFDGYQSLVSQHLWFYGGDPAKGLPSFFYILFFKHQDVGEFRIYSPLGDGPNRLVQGEFGFASEPRQALQVLGKASPELARASLSLDTADSINLQNPRPSLSSDIVLSRIYESPKRAIRPDYADAWLNYRDRVSAEYSFNYVPSRSHFAVLNGPDETPFVNYALELDAQNFSMETDEDQTKFYTTFDVSVEARNKDGVVVFASENADYLELSAGQFQNARASPISYQSNFPLLPGEYDVSIILRNRVLKRYTVAETKLVVPAPSADKLLLSDVILGYAVDELQRTGAAPGELRTFQIGNSRVQPAADSIFSLGETIHVFLQVEGASKDSQLHFALMNGDEAVQEKTVALSTYLGGPVIQRFPLRGMVGGRYTVRVRVLDASGSVLAEREARCQVSPRETITRPWFRRVSFNTASPGLLPLARGDQLVAERRFQEATIEFEKAIAAGGPKVSVVRMRLAWISIQTGDSARGLELLAPMEEEFPNEYAVVAGLGLGYGLQGDCSKGVQYIEHAMTLRAPDTAVLNVAGECYLRMGDKEKAAQVFERSLALNPDQPKVKEVLTSIQRNDG